jgi:ABC-2 type transport system ATP-binding protein
LHTRGEAVVKPAFVARNLEKSYKSAHALAGVSITVEPGQLFGLLGPNGAGKSTLVKIGCGLVRPSRGNTEIFGHASNSAQARALFGYLAELFRFPGWLTADEVLALHQRLVGSEDEGRERSRLLELVGLPDVAHRRVENMSKGMQQRLGIAQALIGSPPLLILDEPTSALDPAGRHAVRALLEELRSRGVAVLLNSHLLSEVELVCDHVAILLNGVIVSEGTPSDLVGGDGVEIDTDNGVLRYPQADRTDVPPIIEELVANGVRVYEVRTARRTLEEVYLEAVRGQMG